MANNIKIKAGNTSIDMSGELASITEDIVNKLLPETRRSLDKELSRIKKEASDRWLVRQTGEVTPEAQAKRTYAALVKNAGKTPDEARAIVASMDRAGKFSGREAAESQKSKRSKDKLYVELAITPNFELIGIVGNKAEYAWAIRVGADTQKTQLQQGKRLSNELLFKPVKKSSDKIAETLANEISKQIK